MFKFNHKGEVLLAAMSAVESLCVGSVQIQKILFLLKDQIGDVTGINGDMFEFEPYFYGPYDESIYTLLKEFTVAGKIRIIPEDDLVGHQRFELTETGKREGKLILGKMPENVRNYVTELVTWVNNCTFSELLSAIYSKYPDMKQNSVFASSSNSN